MGIELQPSSHSSLMSSSDTSSQGVRIADPADALPASSKGQTSAFMVAELEVEEPPAPSSDQKKKTTGNGIGSNGGMLGWRPRGSSIVSLKHIGRKKSNSVSSVQQLSQPQPLPVSEDT